MRENELSKYVEEVSKIKNGVIVEVGCYLGRSMRHIGPIALANNNRLWAIDHWDWERMDRWIKEQLPDPIDVFAIFRANMIQEQIFPQLNVLKMDSIGAAKKFKDSSIDLVFIDASHEYEDVKEDLKAWIPKVKDDGIIMGHDYGCFDGVTRAVREIFGEPPICGTAWTIDRSLVAA